MHYSHGLSRHKHYSRWNSIIQRCYSPNNKNYENYGARGIAVEYAWSAQNPSGVQNFIVWIECELIARPELQAKRFMVIRKDVNKNFSPENCCIETPIMSKQNRRTQVLDAETVIQMRRYKKQNPKFTLAQIQLKFGMQYSINTISRCLRGSHWANLNKIEAPVRIDTRTQIACM